MQFIGFIQRLRRLGGIAFVVLQMGTEREQFLIRGKQECASKLRHIKTGDFCISQYHLETSGDKIIDDIVPYSSGTRRNKHGFRMDLQYSTLYNSVCEQLKKENSVYVYTPTILKGDVKSSTFHLDFFKQKARLTSSGALYLDALSCIHGKVHTIHHVCRAEPSHSRRHLSEFTLIEVAQLGHNLDTCMLSLEELTKKIVLDYASNGGICSDDIKGTVMSNFDRVAYKEACLKYKMTNEMFPLFEKGYVLEKPTFIYNMPTSIASWRAISHGDYALSFNLILPGLGEVAEGSIRSADYETMRSRVVLSGMADQISWLSSYLCLKNVTIGSYGIGLERFLMWLTGTRNIRNINEFYRTQIFSEI